MPFDFYLNYFNIFYTQFKVVLLRNAHRVKRPSTGAARLGEHLLSTHKDLGVLPSIS